MSNEIVDVSEDGKTLTSCLYEFTHESNQKLGLNLSDDGIAKIVFLMMKHVFPEKSNFKGQEQTKMKIFDYSNKEEKPQNITLAEQFLTVNQMPSIAAQARQLTKVGDHALFFVGAYLQNLHRRKISPQYYISLGKSAYGGVAEITESMDGFSKDVYLEISERFSEYSAAINHVVWSSRIEGLANLTDISEPLEASGRTFADIPFGKDGQVKHVIYHSPSPYKN